MIAGQAGAIGDTGRPGATGVLGHFRIGLFKMFSKTQAAHHSYTVTVSLHVVHIVLYSNVFIILFYIVHCIIMLH